MKIKQIAEAIKTALQQKLDCFKNYDYEVIMANEEKYVIKVLNTSSANVITGSALMYIAEVLEKAEKSMPCIITSYVQAVNGTPEYLIIIKKK